SYPEVPAALLFKDAQGKAPLARLTFQFKIVRQDPKVLAGLTLPTSNFIPAVVAGGYFDLLRRGDFVAASLVRDDKSLELKVRATAGTEGMAPAAVGFFAAEQGQAPLPLLRPEGALYSATWFRDFARIWETRGCLLNPEQVKNLESENEKQIGR